MLTKSFLTTAAIALVAGLGSASAGEQFTSLVGIEAEVMSSQSMGEVRGAGHIPTSTGGGSVTIGETNQVVGGHTLTATIGFAEVIGPLSPINDDPIIFLCPTCIIR